MAKQSQDPIYGEIVETCEEISLSELCLTCCVHADRIVELVEEGILEPIGKEVPQWRFSSVSILRVRTVHRLQEDLGVNLAGVALVLDLMDELKSLRSQLRQRERGDDVATVEPSQEA